MNTKYKFLFSIGVAILLCLLAACSQGQSHSQIKGKFVFESSRHLPAYQAHILKDGKIKLLAKEAYGPVWSPDGSVIACSVSKKSNKEIGENGILLVDENGNKKEFIETSSVPMSLSWLPSGDKIAYATDPLDNPKINIYNFKTRQIDTIIQFEGRTDITSVSVSPKGNKIMFWKGKPTEGTYIANIDGSNATYIKKYIMPAWYPDGKHIAYIENVATEASKILSGEDIHIFKMNIETGNIEKIRRVKVFPSYFKISQDGKYFYYTIPYGGGQVIAASPVDDETKQIYITNPIETRPTKYSQDIQPDWYQGE